MTFCRFSNCCNSFDNAFRYLNLNIFLLCSLFIIAVKKYIEGPSRTTVNHCGTAWSSTKLMPSINSLLIMMMVSRFFPETTFYFFVQPLHCWVSGCSSYLAISHKFLFWRCVLEETYKGFWFHERVCNCIATNSYSIWSKCGQKQLLIKLHPF